MIDTLAATERMRVLIIAPSLDGNDVGEVYGTTKWIEALSARADVTVLSSSREGAVPLAQQLPLARVVTWPEVRYFYQKLERFNAIAKPGQPLFNYQVSRWIKSALGRGERFDIAHQMLPQAMRHGSPLRKFSIPYVIGPLGGGLDTPANFQEEVVSNNMFMSALRATTGVRLQYDPILRKSLQQADMILGVAPYVHERLEPIGIHSFRLMHEIGRGSVPPPRERSAQAGKLKLFHAGRVIRTKALRDTVRAMAYFRDLPGVTLVSAGGGEDLPVCRAEAEHLGIADKITFLGKVSRQEVERHYAEADAFCFPSFREPLGGVLLEALAHGLPIITAARGGPEAIIDDSCGIKVPVTDPEQFPRDIASAIRRLAEDVDLRRRLGAGARERYASFDDWDGMAERLIGFYRQILSGKNVPGSALG